jgi:DNA end-binding protein Ku
MPPRAIWKGLLQFGPYTIPVKLHTAVREQRVQFHLLHDKDQVRLSQQMVCAYEHIPVPREEQVKGFEIEDGKFVIIEDKELERFEPEESRTIEIHEFVPAGDIDPLYREKVYYLGPDASQKEYSVLAHALSDMGMEGICTWTMRKRSYVGSVRSSRGMLRLTTLRYADEVIAVESLGLPEVSLSDKELKVGADLVQALTGPFQPDRFENEHQKKLQEMIDRKAAGEKISILRPKKKKATAPDRLLETLEASLKKVG